MQTEKVYTNALLSNSANAEGLDSSCGMMPPDFSLTASTPQTKQDAINRHQTNIQFVESSLVEMESSNDILEKNSAEWVRANAIKLFVGTQTHDTEVRGKAMLNDPDDRAYFGAKKESDKFPNTSATYDENNIPDWDNCRRANKSTEGVANKDYITLFDPTIKNTSKSYLKETIVHEVQHHADHHKDETQVNPKNNVNDAWIGYKTEFRGYWLDGSFDHLSESPPGAFKMSPKQNAIYTKIFSEYSYVPKFLSDTVTRSENSSDIGNTLMRLILLYQTPDGINLENSLRIETMYSTLQECTPQMSSSDPKIIELKDAVLNLTAQERSELFWDDNKDKIEDLMKSNLSEPVYKEIMMLIAET